MDCADEEPPLSQMSVEDGSRAGDEEPGTGKKRKRAGGKVGQSQGEMDMVIRALMDLGMPPGG